MRLFKSGDKKRVSRWWIDLAINLVVTLIAFTLSLFASERSKINAKKATAWNVAQVTLSNIDELINNYEVVTTYYDDFRDQYNLIKEYYKRNERVPDSTCNEFVDYIEGWDVFATNRSPEMTFNTTFELWDYLENIPLIRRIGNCYAYSNAFQELYNRDLQLIANLSLSGQLDKLLDPHQKLHAIMNHIPFRNYMERSGATSSAYHSMIERMKIMNNQNKIDMGVSDKDLDDLIAPLHWAAGEDEDCIFIVGPSL
ncbi:MAG: hypothetical protein J6X58_04365 [Bacteroidales bacterium]|nr:hypothetical protein [Bacteroidales bacterium]